MDVCVQNCQMGFVNSSAINVGTVYTNMMLCIATDPYFATASGFICPKPTRVPDGGAIAPSRALNKWSPNGPPNAAASNCETAICLWNCDDPADSDPFIDLRCMCSSI